jgi:hypothetical protein
MRRHGMNMVVNMLRGTIPNNTLAEAHGLLLSITKEVLNPNFPLELEDTPGFFLALENDPSIEPHATLVFQGKQYVVGTHLLIAAAL